jgi:UDP-3-O-acyl-N-acetylglucosamine deacetylase
VITAKLHGSCLNGGQSLVEISTSDRFGLYLHSDSQPPVNVDYNIANILVQNHSVTVGGQRRLHVVEHLFSALYGFNLFKVRIDVYGDEIPFFDGSSREIGRAVADLDGGESPAVVPPERIDIKEGESIISYLPEYVGGLVVEMALVHPYIGTQRLALDITRETYVKEIMPARTFVFTTEDDPRLNDLPPYGIGITPEKIYAADPSRFTDEPVRHKVLDLLGDLYVLRGHLHGKIVGVNTSHRLNLMFVRKLLSATVGPHV